MKKNKVFTSALIATLLLSGSAATAATVLAAGPSANNGVDSADTTKATGEATITFSDDATTKPILPIDPTDPGVTPTGPLSLVYVTKAVDFGTHRANEAEVFDGVTGDKSYDSKGTADTPAEPLKDAAGKDLEVFHMAVSDARPAKGDADKIAAGWNVTGSMTSSTYDDASAITGVELSIPFTENIVYSLGTADGAVGLAGTLVGDGSSPVAIFTGTTNSIGQSVRTNLVSEMKLKVPAGVQKNGKLTNVLTWTLNSGVVNP